MNTRGYIYIYYYSTINGSLPWNRNTVSLAVTIGMKDEERGRRGVKKRGGKEGKREREGRRGRGKGGGRENGGGREGREEGGRRVDRKERGEWNKGEARRGRNEVEGRKEKEYRGEGRMGGGRRSIHVPQIPLRWVQIPQRCHLAQHSWRTLGTAPQLVCPGDASVIRQWWYTLHFIHIRTHTL